MRTNIFDRLSFFSLFLTVVLLPLFCLPFTKIPLETSKGLLLVLGLVFSVIFWVVARFYDGKIIFPKSWLFLSGFGVVLAFLLSAIFSGSFQASLFGTMFDVGSFWFIFAAFVLMFFSSVIFRNSKQAETVLLGIILSSALILIFQIFHLFMPAILSLGILSGKTGNILGSWNALSLFAGFLGLITILAIEFFPITKTEKLILKILLLLSILLLAVVNFPLAWGLLGIFSLFIFIYKMSAASGNKEAEAGENQKKPLPLISLITVLISLLFFMSSGIVGSFIYNRLQISNNEVSPSFSATMSITKGVLSENPVFGVGLGRFEEAWSMYKPELINNTQFWDTSFGSGSGLLPTLIATTGWLGILAWIIFLVVFLSVGIKSVFFNVKNRGNWTMMAFFLLSLFLFVSSLFYSVGPVIFLLAFAFAGVFIGLSVSHNPDKEILISFLNDPRKSFFTILLLVLAIIISVALSFKYMERFISVFYFERAVLAPIESIAEDSAGKALSLYQNDLYLRTFSQINLMKLSSLSGKGSSLSDTDKADLQASLDKAVSSAQLATAYDSKNYLNFQTLGSVYQAAASLGVKDAYDKAIEAYENASKLNPLNPGLRLAMASVSFAEGKTKEAKDYANLALSLKPDYVDAFIILSQIAKNEGDSKGALSYAQKALSISPANEDLIKYVNSLMK